MKPILQRSIVGLMLLVAFVCLQKTNYSSPIRNGTSEAAQTAFGNKLLRKAPVEFAIPHLFEEDPFKDCSTGDLMLRKSARPAARKLGSFAGHDTNDICPVRLAKKRISSQFAVLRRHPLLNIVRPHHGIDCAAPEGSLVDAVEDGRVVFAGRRGEYGKLVILAHGSGWTTWYGHLSRIERHIKRGVRVSSGETIGRVGATGLATGPHLHFETRMAGKPVNPSRAAFTRAAKQLFE